MKTKARCWLVSAGFLYSVKTGEVRAAPVPRALRGHHHPLHSKQRETELKHRNVILKHLTQYDKERLILYKMLKQNLTNNLLLATCRLFLMLNCKIQYVKLQSKLCPTHHTAMIKKDNTSDHFSHTENILSVSEYE